MPKGRWTALITLVAIVLFLGGAPAATAHTRIKITPASGSELPLTGTTLTITLSEPLRSDNVTLRFAESRGREVPVTSNVGTTPTATIQVAVPALKRGSYQFVVAVTGADGHAVTEVYVYTAGGASLVRSGADLTLGNDASTAARAMGRLGSILSLISLIGIGLVYIGVLIGARMRHLAQFMRVAGVGAVAGMASALVSYLAVSLTWANLDDPSLIGRLTQTAGTQYGRLLLLRVVALGALLISMRRLLACRSLTQRYRLENALMVIGLVLALSYAGASHAAGDQWAFTTLIVAMIHLGSIGLWTSGLFALTVYAGADWGPFTDQVLSRFTRIATWCVALALVSGAVLTFRLTEGLDPQSLKSSYGAALAAKLAAVAVLLLTAFATHRALLHTQQRNAPVPSPEPAGSGIALLRRTDRAIDTREHLARRIRVEAGAATLVLVTAHVLAAWATKP